MDTPYRTYPQEYAHDEPVLPTRWRLKAEFRHREYTPEWELSPPSRSSPLPSFSTDEPLPLPPQRADDPAPRDAGPVAPRRSTRHPGVVKNPYIVREAQNLRLARNRIFELIQAREEAKRSTMAAKALREAVRDGESVLPASFVSQRLLNGGIGASRSGSVTPARAIGKKRKRGDVDPDDDKLDHAYGYGDKDGEDIELENELDKDYHEIVNNFWIEGPAATGAVVTYLKARRRLLLVIDLVRQWEELKVKLNIPDAPPDTASHSKASTSKSRNSSKPRAETPVRRSLRARQPPSRGQAQSDTDHDEPKRKHRRKEVDTSPTKPSGLSTSVTVTIPDAEGNTDALRRSESAFTSMASDASTLSDPEESDSGEVVNSPQPVVAPLEEPQEEPSPKVPQLVLPALENLKVAARKTRQGAKSADNSPQPTSVPLPSIRSEIQSSIVAGLRSRDSPSKTRASSQPVATDADEPRALRSRSKLHLPSRFDEFVPTSLRT